MHTSNSLARIRAMKETPRKRRCKPRRVMQVLLWEEPEHQAGILRYARQAGWIMNKCLPGEEARIKSWAPDGILCQLHPEATQVVQAVIQAGVPIVELSRRVRDMQVPRVRIDRLAEGHVAARHLLECGFRRLAYVGSSSELQRENNAYEGFRETAETAGASVVLLIWDNPDALKAMQICSEWRGDLRDEASVHRRHWLGEHMFSLPKPVGVFVSEISLCNDLMDGSLEAGVLIPEQVAVITHSGRNSIAECLAVPVTTVIIDFEGQAYQAAALLDSLMAGKSAKEQTIRVPPLGVTVRDSTRVIAVENVDVARAVKYIMDNLHEYSLSAKTVMLRTGLSQGSLYHGFEKYVGMPIARYIQHLRVTEACHLLETTALTATVIAEQCGFKDLRHFRRALRRTNGKTPRAYRAEKL